MLRPACLLPVARLSPPDGLSTPRSDVEVSLRSPGACYSALRRLPRRDSHPLETRSVQTPDSLARSPSASRRTMSCY